MIGYIKGRLIYKKNENVLIETGGIGYRVFLSKSDVDQLSLDDQVEFYCFHHIREDTSELFGFKSSDDLEIFEKLMQVSGVGPKVALSIVSSLGREKIIGALGQNNPTVFQSVSGVGGKLAAKIVIELKSKISGGDILMPQSDETVEALVALGYKKQEIIPYVSQLPPELVSVNEKIRYILKLISSNKV